MPKRKQKVMKQLPSLPEISPILQAAKMVDEAYKKEMNGNILVLSNRMQYALRYLSDARIRMEKEAVAKYMPHVPAIIPNTPEWVKRL